MKVYTVYESDCEYEHTYGMYDNLKAAKACLKKIRYNRIFYEGGFGRDISIRTEEVHSDFDPVRERVGYNYEPKYIQVRVDPFTDEAHLVAFVTSVQDQKSIDEVRVFIHIKYEIFGKKWNSRPSIDYMIPYVKLPYFDLTGKVKKSGMKMLQRVKPYINFEKYRNVNAYRLIENGYHVPDEVKDRWTRIATNLKNYYGNRVKDIGKVDTHTIWLCAPGLFIYGEDDAMRWEDYGFKTLDELKEHPDL